MTQCLALQCPLCGQESLVPADGASKDVFADRIAGHVHTAHPGTMPGEAEEAVRTAVENVEPTEVDRDPEELGGWE